MKKYLATLLILSLLLCSLLGCTVTASASTSSASDIHLVNPSSIAVVGDTLYIADNITDSNSVLLIFDIASDTPIYTDMIEYDGNISLLRVYGDTLYLLLADRYITWDTTTDVTTTYATAIQDIAILTFNNTTYTYTIVDNTIYRGSTSKWQADSMAIAGSQMYLLYGNTSATITLVEGDSINEPGTAGYTDSLYSYVTTDSTQLAYCNSSSILLDNTTIDLQLTDTECIVLHGNNILALHNNQITQYTATDSTYSEGFTIGSDTVSLTVPSLDDITAYTVVQSTGYPTNIVYKTTDDTSIDNLLELSSQSVIVLDYDGAIQSSYYYIYTESGFGWIKKGADSLAEESTMTIISTELNSTATYNAKFISPGSVTIYQLPTTEYVRDTFTQTVTDATTVTLLQQFTDSASTTWYYISYIDSDGTTQYGFVMSSHIGYIYSAGVNTNIVLDSDTPYLKVDAGLTSDVYMYLTEDMNSNEQLVDSDGEYITLSDGTRVSVITVGNSASYIQVIIGDSTYYGWVANDNMISTNALTSTTVTGLILLSVAVLLIVATLVIIKARKNNLVRNDIV